MAFLLSLRVRNPPGTGAGALLSAALSPGVCPRAALCFRLVLLKLKNCPVDTVILKKSRSFRVKFKYKRFFDSTGKESPVCCQKVVFSY